MNRPRRGRVSVWRWVTPPLGIALLFSGCSRAQSPTNVLVLHEGNANNPAKVISSGVYREVFVSSSPNQIFEESMGANGLGASAASLAKPLGAKNLVVFANGRPALTSYLAAIGAQLALLIILGIEIRRRRRSDSAVKDLAGRVINAGEEERKRIAGELHDDIGQRLSVVAIQLDMMNQVASSSKAAIGHALDEPLQQLNEVITDVHTLSYNLHSRQLQVLGLEAALKGVCKQLSKQHGLEVKLGTECIPARLPDDLALCFYRVAQEGLNNSVKHSGSGMVNVTLTAVEGTLTMAIKDYGSGFDPAAASNGLGLATMRERLRSLGGTLTIISKLGEGTELRAQARLALSSPPREFRCGLPSSGVAFLKRKIDEP